MKFVTIAAMLLAPITLADYKKRSKDFKGLNPVYNQTFCFYVRSGLDKLHVKVIDKDTLKNDKIDDTSIPLSNVLVNGKEGQRNISSQSGWVFLATEL
ncbi:hypothetical protein BGW39_003747 [Mortierella sp. 14UC]|nr:hypothetical protein BGW39_003747 [Mortierella sp. 14UC]